MSGKFIVFEGIDGSGKSTQLALLQQYLIQRGYNVLTTREPGGTKISEEIRSLLLNPAYKDLDYRTEAFLYSSARAQLVYTKIKPALAAGKIVLCDRFVDSTLAYQGYGRSLPLEFLHSLNQLATGGLSPDKVLVFDLPLEQSFSRVKNRSAQDRLESEPSQFHRQVREGYLKIARQHGETHVVLNATLSIDELHQQVVTAVEALLNV
ncbi:dTMP kinase [Peptococcaceae bacterium 1198_IL3148]